MNDPVTGYLHVKVSYGSAKIIKTSEDGIVSGIRFTITGNGVNETVMTGENGEIQIDDLTPVNIPSRSLRMTAMCRRRARPCA